VKPYRERAKPADRSAPPAWPQPLPCPAPCAGRGAPTCSPLAGLSGFPRQLMRAPTTLCACRYKHTEGGKGAAGEQFQARQRSVGTALSCCAACSGRTSHRPSLPGTAAQVPGSLPSSLCLLSGSWAGVQGHWRARFPAASERAAWKARPGLGWPAGLAQGPPRGGPLHPRKCAVLRRGGTQVQTAARPCTCQAWRPLEGHGALRRRLRARQNFFYQANSPRPLLDPHSDVAHPSTKSPPTHVAPATPHPELWAETQEAEAWLEPREAEPSPWPRARLFQDSDSTQGGDAVLGDTPCVTSSLLHLRCWP